ncbi:hypothetical protein ACFLVC_03295 [Chloroflexota bacterium]
MLEGRCPKCGYCRVGEALRIPRNQSCAICGAALMIYLDGKKLSEGYSPFTAEKYSRGQTPGVSSPSHKPEDSTL